MKCKCGKKATVSITVGMRSIWFCSTCFDKAATAVGKKIRKKTKEVLHE